MSEQDTGTTPNGSDDNADTDQRDAGLDPVDSAQGRDVGQDSGGKAKGDKDAVLADLAKERRQRQALEKRLKDIEDSKLSDLERLQRQAKEASDRAEKAERAALRQQVAIKHQLPADLAKRLQGETEDELEVDAAELARLIVPKGPRPDPSQGSRANQSGPVDMNSLIRQSATRR